MECHKLKFKMQKVSFTKLPGSNLTFLVKSNKILRWVRNQKVETSSLHDKFPTEPVLDEPHHKPPAESCQSCTRTPKKCFWTVRNRSEPFGGAKKGLWTVRWQPLVSMISTFKTDNLEVNPDVCRSINSRFQIGGLQWRWGCGRAGQAGQGWQCMGHPRLMLMGLFSSMLKRFCKNMWNMLQVENWIIEHIRYV